MGGDKILETNTIILAVDDEPIVLNSIISLLKSDYKVNPVTSGKGALKYLEKTEVDLILLDINMPGMSGYETLKQIKQCSKTASVPIIFLTGNIADDSEIVGLKLGAVDYIFKPIKPEVLLTRIKVHLELEKYRKDLEKLVENQTKELQLAYKKVKKREETTLDLLARVTDFRDKDTGGHIQRTTEYVSIIVGELLNDPHPDYNLTGETAEDIIKSAKLHDIGKVALPDAVLLKHDRLTPEEFELVKLHTTYGAQMLEQSIKELGEQSFLRFAYEIAAAHHEKWNGEGYPNGLSGNQIPLSAKIMALADVYDALTSVRSYKPAFSIEYSESIILKNKGIHFDPYLTDIFFRVKDKFAYVANKFKTNAAKNTVE